VRLDASMKRWKLQLFPPLPGILAGMLLWSAAALGQPARGLVALSAEGMVVSAEKHATEAGAAVLARGGNAVDAAVAVAFALAVTHPTAGNLGGGGFMIVYLNDGRAVAVDYREVAPLAATRDMYLDETGELAPDKSTVGGLAAGIPGTVAGLGLALGSFGTMPLAQLVAPAERLAREGHRLDERHAAELARSLDEMRPFPSSMAIFSKGGRPFEAGDLLVQTDLAATLSAIAQGGAGAFYEGALARRLVRGARAAGAIWSERDLAGYRAVLREPLRLEYRGHTILSMPPPSSGGVVLAQMLLGAEMLQLAAHPPYSAEQLHLYAEVARRMYADRNTWLGDPDFVANPIRGLLEPAYIRSRVADIDPLSATASVEVRAGAPAEGGQTTHFSVVDRHGNAVSNTYTLNLQYGSKAVATGTGVLLNNEMDDFSAKPGTPNSFGLVQGERNAIAPRKRMLSSMTPSIVLEGPRVRLVLGSPGGSTIITTVFQLVRHVLDHGLSLESAVRAPRVHHQGLPDQITFEAGALEPAVLRELEARGHKLVEREPIGAAHVIEVRRDGGIVGVVDLREGGLAAGPQGASE
jgi:gamma-glutamyltranspeptidase / glutathione hydrolase